MEMQTPKPTLLKRPGVRELADCLMIAALGTALGLCINAFSPRGFDFKMAAGSSSSEVSK
jgi:hypothetical protein